MTISIITINKNNAAGLAKTMASVFAQSYQPIEYIVIDAGSTDNSVAIIKESVHKISYWISEEDNGVYHAQNKGLAAAQASHVLFLNSGDCFCGPQSLAHLANAVVHSQQIVYGNLEVENDDGSHWLKPYPDSLPPNYFDYETLPHPATLIGRYWLQKLGGYDETLRICSDWKFFWQVFRQQPACFTHVNQAISRFAAGGISSLAEHAGQIEKEKQQVRAAFAANTQPSWVNKMKQWLKA